MGIAVSPIGALCFSVGGEPFSYQSCTPAQQRLPAVLHGEFTFVKGSLTDPNAQRFKARVRAMCHSK